MPRFAANLGYLFTERPMIERIGAAAAAGFKAVELQFPYDVPASAVKAELERHGLTQLGMHQIGEGHAAPLPVARHHRVAQSQEDLGLPPGHRTVEAGPEQLLAVVAQLA